MAYQDQRVSAETLESKQAEFDAALKAYQEKATALAIEIENREEKLSTLLLDEKKLNASLAQIKSDLAEVQAKRDHIHQEIDSVMTSKLAELDKQKKDMEADLEKRGQLLTEQINGLALEKAEFQAGLKAIQDGNDALAFRESQLVAIEKTLKEREEAIVTAEEKVHQEDEEIKQMHEQADNRHALLDERERRIKTQEDQLQQEKVSFNLSLSEHQKAADELAVKIKALADVAAEQQKLALDLKEFGEAKSKMELREAALSGLEQQLKRWEQDLKQQEEALIEKAKGVEP